MSDDSDERDRSNDPDAPDDLTDAEKEALHQMQVGVEHVGRARGRLLDFHHEIGDAFDHFEAARETLRAAGYDDLADELRDRHLPAGVIGDRWTFELVTNFEEGFYDEIATFAGDLREEVGDGEVHVRERDLQSEWRGRAESGAWKSEGETEAQQGESTHGRERGD
jgi:hypothetical protein